MEFEYHEKLPVNNDRTVSNLVTSNKVKRRRNIEVVEENEYDESTAEVILRYTGSEDRDCERRHIVVSGEDDIITINAVLQSKERAPGIKVALKGISRNIRSSIAQSAASESL